MLLSWFIFHVQKSRLNQNDADQRNIKINCVSFWRCVVHFIFVHFLLLWFNFIFIFIRFSARISFDGFKMKHYKSSRILSPSLLLSFERDFSVHRMMYSRCSAHKHINCAHGPLDESQINEKISNLFAYDNFTWMRIYTLFGCVPLNHHILNGLIKITIHMRSKHISSSSSSSK